MNLMQPEEHAESALDTWKIFFRLVAQNRKLILLIVAATLMSAYLILQLMSDKYKTEASLLVKLGRENVEVPVTAQSGNVTTLGIRKEEINSEVQMLKSSSLMEQIVDKLGTDFFTKTSDPSPGLFSSVKHAVKEMVRWGKKTGEAVLTAFNLVPKLDDRQKAILNLQKSILVEPVKDSDVISILYQDTDPERCLKVADTMLQLYFENHTRVRRNSAAKDFYQEQVESNMKRLGQIEANRDEVQSKWSLYSVADQRSLLLKELMELRTQMDIHASERAMYRQQQVMMRARMDVLPDAVDQSQTAAPNPTILQYKDRIANLQLEKAKLSSRFAPGSQTITDIDAQISTLTNLSDKEAAIQIAAHVTESNPLKRDFQQNIEQLDVKIAGLDAKIKEIQQPVAKIESTLKTLNSGETQLDNVNRERALAEALYVDSAKRLEEARISNQLDQDRVANVAVMSPPVKPVEPVSPRRLLIMGVALPAATFLAIGIVLFMHYAQAFFNGSLVPAAVGEVSAVSRTAVASGDETHDGGSGPPKKRAASSAG